MIIRSYLNGVADDERGVESNTELTDDVVCAALTDFLGELLRSGSRDCSEVGDELLTSEADAVVSEDDLTFVCVCLDLDLVLFIKATLLCGENTGRRRLERSGGSFCAPFGYFGCF